jgi:protein-S-isoprenylcysteine O-methyltransferase Ste14
LLGDVEVAADRRASRAWVGGLLVALQMGLLALLAMRAGPAFLAGPVPAVAWALAAGGVALGAWALTCNRPGNFNVRPIPREGGRLVQEGPYRWIRHPMYTALILCGVAAAWTRGSAWDWIAVVALAAVLVVKAALEERWMLRAHPGYAAYRARTRRFLPGIV